MNKSTCHEAKITRSKNRESKLVKFACKECGKRAKWEIQHEGDFIYSCSEHLEKFLSKFVKPVKKKVRKFK